MNLTKKRLQMLDLGMSVWVTIAQGVLHLGCTKERIFSHITFVDQVNGEIKPLRRSI